MTVILTASKTLGGAEASDSLTGGGTGFQFGTTEAGVTPATQLIYLRHDGTALIENLQMYVRPYSQTYGGEYSAAADHTKLAQQGLQSAGFQVDFNWTGIEFATFTTLTAALGTAPVNAIDVPITSIFRNNGGVPVAASAPVQGEVGASGNTTLGDTALLRCRWAVPLAELQPGRRQVDIAFTYNFTT